MAVRSTLFLKYLTKKTKEIATARKKISVCAQGGKSSQRIKSQEDLGTSGHGTAACSYIKDLSFEDHQDVFRGKTSWELFRGLLILLLCSSDKIVKNSLQLMRFGEKALGKRLFSALARPTIYSQFVGGDDKQTMKQTMDRLHRLGLRTMVISVQEEDVEESSSSRQKYDTNLLQYLDTVDLVTQAGSGQPSMQCKVTACMSADITVKLSRLLQSSASPLSLVGQVAETMSGGPPVSFQSFSKEENIQLNEGIERHVQLGRAVEANQLRLLIDAEYTAMNPAITLIALAMMCVFNNDTATVWNTYQCYLQSSFDAISRDADTIMHKMGLYFGAKVVRGAYMRQERQRAQDAGYPDPINKTYEDTGKMYNRVTDKMLSCISQHGPKCNIIVATHNEAAVLHAASRLRALGLDSQSGEVVFGQIYGMAEHLSIPLANAGYIVYKSVPYGPLPEALSYLSRRVADNSAVVLGSRKERELMMRELKFRVTNMR